MSFFETGVNSETLTKFYGNETWVEHKENLLLFSLMVQKEDWTEKTFYLLPFLRNSA